MLTISTASIINDTLHPHHDASQLMDFMEVFPLIETYSFLPVYLSVCLSSALFIVIWDANTGVTLSVIKYHKKGISNIQFASNGTLLVSIGMDDDRTIAVHNTRTSALVGTGKAGRGE